MPEEPTKPEEKQKDEKRRPLSTEPPVTTQHQITIQGKPLKYDVTTGFLPLTNDFGEHEANVFFIAYTVRASGKKPRPLMFSFNGGPGSSSVWLHLGTVGPKRAKMLPGGELPPPPYQLVDNAHTWLTETDVVFIDPVGTGFSRAATEELDKKFWGLKGDVESVGEFIRLYLSRYDRWASPLFLVGESYGTTRAAGLAGHLIEKGITFNGIVLVSAILNFQTARFTQGNELPYVLFLPSYCATAYYHKRIDTKRPLRETLKQCEEWATKEYYAILQKGDLATDEERARAVKQLARFTGLRQEFIDLSNLRINIHQFCKELLRDERRTVGRLDSRFKGIDKDIVEARPEHDPAMAATRPPYTAMVNDYIRRQLKFRTDEPYHVFGEKLWEKWDWGSAGQGHPDTSDALRDAMSKNPYMKVLIASGYYDLATPYFATEWTLAHMGLDPSLRENFTTEEFEAGHMMYIDEKCLRQLKSAASRFLRDASRLA